MPYKGKVHYFRNDAQLDAFKADNNGAQDRGLTLQGSRRDGPERAVGDDARPAITARCLKVTMEDAALAEEIFSTLMGDDVEARKTFIQRNAKDVRFLDI